jgi:hypothetical protein
MSESMTVTVGLDVRASLVRLAWGRRLPAVDLGGTGPTFQTAQDDHRLVRSPQP